MQSFEQLQNFDFGVLMNINPEMVYQALFDTDALLQNQEVHKLVHPMVQNHYDDLQKEIKDQQRTLEWEDNWIKDYEKNGDFGEELEYIDDLTDDVENEIKEDLEDEFDVKDMWNSTDSLWTFFLVFRWLLNLVFIATPWIFFSQIFFAWNVLFNAKWNFLWAGGNVYLIGNTIYAYIFTWLSVFVVMEMPIYMKHMKIVRGFAWFSAIIYNILYWISFGDFLLLLFYYDKETFDLFYLMEAMFFGYNIILHCPITVVNNVIILKEIGLEFFQASATRHGHNLNIALGLRDGWNFILTMLSVLNPMTYLKFARNEFYDKLYRKYITNEPVIKHHYK